MKERQMEEEKVDERERWKRRGERMDEREIEIEEKRRKSG